VSDIPFGTLEIASTYIVRFQHYFSVYLQVLAVVVVYV